MNHSVYGKKLSRNTDERKRLIKNLLKSLIFHGAIKTTQAKAKAIAPTMDKIITKAKKGTDVVKRQLYAVLSDRIAAKTIMDMAATRFSQRTSGYTRIIKIGRKTGDASQQVILSFVDEEVKTEIVSEKKSSLKTKKETKQSVQTKEKEKQEKTSKRIKKEVKQK